MDNIYLLSNRYKHNLQSNKTIKTCKLKELRGHIHTQKNKIKNMLHTMLVELWKN